MSRPVASLALAALLILPSGAGRARPAVAVSGISVYGGRTQYEGRQGAANTPTASGASSSLSTARGSIPPTRALRLPGREGFSLPTHRHHQTPAVLDPLRPWLPVFGQQAQATGVPASLLEAVALVESGGNPWAEDPQGDVGLMQLQHGTARQMGVVGRRSPVASIIGGSRYLAWLGHLEGVTSQCWSEGLRAGGACGWRIDRAVSGYNAGPSGQYQPDYVTSIRARWSEIDAEERAA